MMSTGVTFVDHVRPDGTTVRWGSRRHRTHQQSAGGSTWWAPGARGWWIAVLFAIGSLLHRGRHGGQPVRERRAPACVAERTEEARRSL